jgi:tRNA(adenine34) deaminase
MRYINFGDGPNISPDDFFMNEAIREAKAALAEDEIPIGAIVVCKGQIIGRGHNLTERLNDVSAHAEMQALTAAANFLGGKYLSDCTLYVSAKPYCFWSLRCKIRFRTVKPKDYASQNIDHRRYTGKRMRRTG